MPEEHIIKNALVKETVQDGEIILLNPETAEYFGLNESGQAIWKILGDDVCTMQALLRDVALFYGTDELSIAAPVRHFLDSLRDRRLITVSA